MKKKMIKNLMLVVVMVVLCVAVGMTASAGNYEDIWSQGFANENQAVIVFDLEGGKIDGTVENFNLETMSFETVTELSGKYVMVPKNETEQAEGSHILFPSIIAPDEYHEMIGWHLVEHNTVYAPGCLFFIPESTAGTIIKFTALYEDNTPYNLVNGELTAGENLSWFFDKTTGTLEISGDGPMYDFDTSPNYTSNSYYKVPWEDFREEIKHVVIGDGVTSVGNKAFENCYNLIDVKLSDSVISIGDTAFSYCLSLSDFTMSDNITTIGEMAFFMCLSLKSVKLPKTISSIAYGAFGNLLFLEEFTIESKTVDLGELAICANECSIVDISCEDFVDLCIKFWATNDADALIELDSHIAYGDSKCFADVRAHEGSSTETYIEDLKELYKEAGLQCDITFIPTHFFEGEWLYDAENKYCYRQCIHCDEREISEDIGDVEIEAPVIPDTDFTVDVVEDYVVIEETISNNITTDFEIVKAFDINLKNKDGVHVQPDGTVKVKLPNDWSKSGVYKVYRVNDDGTLTDMNAYRQGSHLVFETDHFSVYVIVVEDEAESAPDEPQEETKLSFFERLANLIRAFFDMIKALFGN